ncbi:mycofactocin biosynthesis chaperone MftB [Rhodococcus kroppenstedtii]|uniref:mycofactocin biosynthesis chaperone MftB n=1 Tax=Rhodococcoides kroppenstedtii TaxID=293050 RepID=UPI002953EE68|nr:mycofactocin biosynthesis chaperone MftB [Rhodococcus kroppenstedtii]MDV7196162.1 mycofactocin biosynthesis chaperone MftB [Rhodococcus kroppenstedtii]
MTAAASPTAPAGSLLTGRWQLAPQVAVRPEPFGALLYHFGTRRLSFLKTRGVLAVVRSLPEHPDVRSALSAAAVPDDAVPQYLHALTALAESSMIVPAQQDSVLQVSPKENLA